jgi:hypothetical protein
MKASSLLDSVATTERKLRSRRGTFDVKPLEKEKKLSDAQVRAIEKRIGHPIPVLLPLCKRGFMHVEDDTDEIERFFAEP